ncbi:ABC transporter substrate-binding protein [Paenibacillus glycanilyticus]|uniref:Sugar ABC transporter substrate-binding protein n=1 Tax=Paenibacillus glycanilyticus TaxID=126569 RepID=A0ABQ6GJA8_9BACL|nr:extracellular solute-binding protein [Paenibacillus glycanilyticus]GLX70313.1 sugar ABC transporter substrate-binding protein [Paenibacillus glycanilyticus]
MNKKQLISTMAVLGLAMTMAAGCGSNNGNNEGAAAPSNNKGNNAAATTEADNAAASNAAASEEPAAPAISGKVVFTTNRTDLVDTELKNYATKFHEKYPDATVEIEAIKDYDQTTKIRMASNELADISLIPGTVKNSDLPNFYLPLDDLGLNDRIYFKDNRSQDGKLYGISSGSAAMGVTYNKKAFAQAGITAVPKTLDELYAAADKLKAAGIIPLATNFKDKWPLYGWDQEAFIFGNDPALHNTMATQDEPFAVDGPHWQAFSILKKMVDSGYVEKDLMSTNWEGSKKDVASGKIAMFLLGNWVVPQVVDNGAAAEDVGFFPLPLDNSGEAKVILASDYYYGIDKNSDNPETAKAFLKFLIEESGYDDYAGFIPVLKDKQPKLAQLNEFMATNPKVIEMSAENDDYLAIANKMQFDTSAFAQDAIMGKDMKAVFDSYNKKWKDAKASVGK